jgi:hypothetical protein
MIFVVASSVSSILFFRISMLKNKFKKTFSMFGVTMLSNVHFDLNEFDENQPNQGVTMLSNVHFNGYRCYVRLDILRQLESKKRTSTSMKSCDVRLGFSSTWKQQLLKIKLVED